MPTLSRPFLDQIESHLRFEYRDGASTWVTHPHTTGWRVLPSLMVAQIKYAAVMEIADRKPIGARPGQTIIVAPGRPHRITMRAGRAGYSHWSHVQVEVFPGVSLFDLVDLPATVSGRTSQKIGRINRALGRIPRGEGALAMLSQRQALGWELIATLLSFASPKEARAGLLRHASRLMPVLAYVEANLSQPITHALLARTGGLSPSRFHALFRSALGCAPYEYVQRLRLRKAQELLVRSDDSIAEIGREVGHPDAYHFSRVFRRSVGLSPREYRRQRALDSF